MLVKLYDINCLRNKDLDIFKGELGPVRLLGTHGVLLFNLVQDPSFLTSFCLGKLFTHLITHMPSSARERSQATWKHQMNYTSITSTKHAITLHLMMAAQMSFSGQFFLLPLLPIFPSCLIGLRCILEARNSQLSFHKGRCPGKMKKKRGGETYESGGVGRLRSLLK